MNRLECMQRLAARLKDEVVVLSLGASVDEWTTPRPTCAARAYSSSSLGCVTHRR
jgi:hypothetical protein